MITGLITLCKTKYSNGFRDTLSSGGRITLQRNGTLQPLVDIVKTIGHTKLECNEFNLGASKFLSELKSRKLNLAEFLMHFDTENNSYHFAYTVQSRIHKNDAFRVDGYFQSDNVLFAFAPSMLRQWFLELVGRMPLAELDLVAQGQ